MNIVDEKKFVSVFVDFIKDGIATTPSDEEHEHIWNKLINPYYKEGWETFLRRKASSEELEDEDVWERWYNNLTFDDITEEEHRIFRLPSEKIVINFGWTEELMLGLYNCVKGFVEEAQKLPLYESNVIVGYKIGRIGVHAYFCVPNHVQLPTTLRKKTHDPAVYSKVYNLYKKWICGDGEGEGQAEKLLQKYKPIAAECDVIIKGNNKRSSGVGKGDDDSYEKGKWWDFDLYALQEGGNKTYIDKMFGFVDDRFESKRLPDN